MLALSNDNEYPESKEVSKPLYLVMWFFIGSWHGACHDDFPLHASCVVIISGPPVVPQYEYVRWKE